jgi:hypothetical protein
MRKKKPKKKVSDVVAPELETVKTEETIVEKKVVEQPKQTVQTQEIVETVETTVESVPIVEEVEDEIEEIKIVTIKPSFIVKPKSIMDIVEGSPIIFQAKVKALPQPNIVLLKNKKQIVDFEEFQCSYNIYTENEITTIEYQISEAELNKHEGIYHIHISNDIGEVVCGIQVNLKGKCSDLNTEKYLQ